MGYAETYVDLAKGDERQGVLHTGDLAKFDTDGFFYIVGRMKRFVKLYGNRVGLDELEQMIAAKFGQTVCLGNDERIVIVTEDASLDEKSVVEYVAGRTHLNSKVFSLFHIEGIPHLETGKIDYKTLEKLYLS